jgi:hypothetical protein
MSQTRAKQQQHAEGQHQPDRGKIKKIGKHFSILSNEVPTAA